LYLFTDGYIDQLGGENIEKFYICNFQDLLLSIQELDLENQHTVIADVMNKWILTYPQIDDMLIIGIKL